MTDVLYICPKCNNVLERMTVGLIEVDKCTVCSGVWLDRGELVKLHLARDHENMQTLLEERGTLAVPPSSTTVNLSCPACEGSMTTIALDEFLLDRCESCHGWWLDRGELQPTLNALQTTTDTRILDLLLGLGS